MYMNHEELYKITVILVSFQERLRFEFPTQSMSVWDTTHSFPI